MQNRLRFFTYLALVLGVMFLVGYFSGFMAAKLALHRNQPSGFIRFVLEFYPIFGFIVGPFAAFGVVTFLLMRWIDAPFLAGMSLASAIAVDIVGIILYFRLFYPPPFDPDNPDAFEPALVFFFAPMYHFGFVILCSIVCLIVALFIWIRSKKTAEPRDPSSDIISDG